MKTLIFRFASCLLIYFTVQAAAAAFAAGVVDRSFGTNGTVMTPLPIIPVEGDIAIQPDGKYIVAADGGDSIRMARFNENGTLDSSFGNNGTITHSVIGVDVIALGLQSDGKIIVVGTVYENITPSPPSDFFIARFNSQGNFDSSFGTNGIKTVHRGYIDKFLAVAIQTDGKILAAGPDAGGSGGVIIRFTASGAVDTTFANQGAFAYAFPNTGAFYSGHHEIKVLTDGRILAGGSFAQQNPIPANSFHGYYLVMLDAGGAMSPDFGSQGVATGGRIQCCGVLSPEMDFEILPTGRIFLAFGGGVRVLNQNGSLYKQLPFEGRRTSIFTDGRVLVLGTNSGLMLYSEKVFIGWASGLRPHALPNGKILMLYYDFGTGSIVHTRLNLITSHGTGSSDIDHDDRADAAVYNHQTQMFSARRSYNNTTFTKQEYLTKVIPDLNESRDAQNNLRRDGVTFWRNGLLNNTRPMYGEFYTSGQTFNHGFWGLPDDMPVGGDFDGDGFTDFTVFRPSDGYWYSMRGEGGGHVFFKWGMQGDKPVPADYDYDGKTDYAIYRPSTGTWWIHRSSDNTYFGIKFGLATDIPVTGDYDGDGRADFSVYRASEGIWYHHLTTEGFRATRFGLPEDYPVPGDYDADGRHDIAVYRRGYWYIQQSREGFKALQLGDNSEWVKPVSIRYDE